ncbi:aldehyde dehydrogenase family protein, partial [Mesorhizobium sp. M1233]
CNLPAGTVSLVVGPTSTTYAPIMASPAVRKVSLTGSTRVGNLVRAERARFFRRADRLSAGGKRSRVEWPVKNLNSESA